MYFLKPVNTSSVARCKYLVVVALATFWFSLAAFFLAPLSAFVVVLAIHLIASCLSVTQCYRVLMYLVLAQGGEGAVAGAANSAPAPAPEPKDPTPIT